MRCKVYITDEGFGPIVRQNAILSKLCQKLPELEVTLQLQRHLSESKRLMPNYNYIDKYNNITWHKTLEGFPDVAKIKEAYENYNEIANAYILEELNDFKSDFVISDFVYEAFEIAYKMDRPAFGVAHFTWDWFFSKLYPTPLKSEVMDRFFDYAFKARAIYFPPFTPQEILGHYKNKAVQVPLIVGDHASKQNIRKEGKLNVLIMDSGSGVLHSKIKTAIMQLSKLNDFHFFISSQFELQGDNISQISKDDFFIDYISQMDLVIGRAGFNTISECIAFRTPMLLLSEAMNPEMNENIINIKYQGLGSFISLEQFSTNLNTFLPRFIDSEFPLIKENMQNHDIPYNGAEVVANDILNKLS